jgi:hypothetical protein
MSWTTVRSAFDGVVDENARLKKLLAESMLNASASRELLGKTGKARRQAKGCRSSANSVPDKRAAGLLPD